MTDGGCTQSHRGPGREPASKWTFQNSRMLLASVPGHAGRPETRGGSQKAILCFPNYSQHVSQAYPVAQGAQARAEGARKRLCVFITTHNTFHKRTRSRRAPRRARREPESDCVFS